MKLFGLSRSNILAHTYEKLTIPNDCGGKIEGRSSFARLGLGVHFASDFINPGYRGQLPIQLFNYGENDIIIFPYIPICQLVLVKLMNQPERLYSDMPRSKYMDEDGGPSRWWVDDRIEALQAQIGGEGSHNRLIDKMVGQPSEIMERFIKFIQSSKLNTAMESDDTILAKFRESERRLERIHKFIKWFSRGISGTAFLLFCNSFISTSGLQQSHLWCLSVCVFSGLIALWYWHTYEEMCYYTQDS
jgi:hypothetical protein